MVDGVIYLDTGKQMAVEMEESAFLGTITSSVDGSEMPHAKRREQLRRRRRALCLSG